VSAAVGETDEGPRSAAPDICPATGKRRYASKAKAFTVAKWTSTSNRRRAKTQAHRVPCHAYRCEHCQGFHVGHLSREAGATKLDVRR
jgi:hypothetical protein